MYRFVYKLRKFLAFSFACACLLAASFSQESLVADLDMKSVPYSWLSVLSGSAICRPIKTSYGWLDFTEGKMAAAFTQGGQVLWQKSLPSMATPMAAVDKDDFALVVLKNKRLCLLNPSGLVLWQKPLDFEAKFAPLMARDGRLYVFGKDSAACYGMNGVQKWKQKFDGLSSALEPRQLDDGSLLLFLEALEGSKTAALRISPFGETLERIVFAGKVTASAEAEGGVLLAFDDGSAGLCSAGGGEAKSKWLLKDLGLGGKVVFAKGGRPGTIAAASRGAPGTKVTVFDERKAAVECVFEIPEISVVETDEAFYDGIFLADADRGAFYSYGGKKARGAVFPPRTKKFNWDYVLRGSNGDLILTSKNWSFAAWRFVKNSPPPKAADPKKKDIKAFCQNLGKDHPRALKAASKERKARLEAGGYGADEKVFLFDAGWILDSFFEKAMRQKSVGGQIGSLDGDPLFSFSLGQEAAVISTLSLFGSEDASYSLARVLRAAADESVLLCALKSVQECGYDPGGGIMDALEALFKEAKPGQETLLKELCGALYSVCRFMGRPALYKKGLKILSNLQLPQYPNSTKEEARKIYEKLAQLKI